MSPRVLLTGGRAPATLDLARRLHEGGAEVHLAESLPGTVSSLSRAVTRTWRVPGPRQHPDAFLDALRTIVDRASIDLLLPTCEEVFWVARGPDLPTLLESRERLRRVHDKVGFIHQAEQIGLAVPDTFKVTHRSGLLAAVDDLGGPEGIVIKPSFSRFATSVRIRPTLAELDELRPSAEAPLAVQRFVPGPIACSWSVAHAGRLTVHTAYRARFTAGPGSAIHFVWLPDEALRQWVTDFAARTRWTGQLAFDFVLTDDGPVAIECNPRLTSGAHLLADGCGLLRALTDPDAPRVEPEDGAAAQITAAMLLYGLPRALRTGDIAAWWAAVRSAREVSWDPRDLRPFVLQGVAIAGLAARALSVGEGLLDASTWDIRWDGE